MSDDRVANLRDALRDWAKTPLADRDPVDAEASLRNPFNVNECRYVFDLAGVEIPATAFDRVAAEFRRLGFYGGTFTQDAQRLLAALAPDPETQCTVCGSDTATARCCGWPKDDERQDYDR